MNKIYLGFALLLSAVSLPAHAQTIQVAKFSVDPGQEETPASDYDLGFGYNDSGKAWVSVYICEGSGDNSSCGYAPYLVNGLSYDTSTKRVLFGNTLCANVVPGFLGIGESVRKTGSCVLSSTTETENYDNGFQTVQETYDVITMDVK